MIEFRHKDIHVDAIGRGGIGRHGLRREGSLGVVGLFFWQKSRETGVFLALGASRKRLKRELRRDLAGIFLGSCASGVILGTPLAWGLWQVFQALVVDTKEMPLTFKHLHPGLRCLCN